MENITISQWSTKKLEDKVNLYVEIFGEDPRNEWYIDWDWNLYPLSYDGDLTWMSLFYNKEDFAAQRLNRTKKDWYIECIASVLKNDKLVGFTLWWSDTLSNLNKEKFNLCEKEYALLLANIANIIGNNSINQYFYAADLWVSRDYRWCWIASQLYDARYKNIVENNTKVIVVRTTKNRAVPYNRYREKWFQEVYSYGDVQNRVIMILPLNPII